METCTGISFANHVGDLLGPFVWPLLLAIVLLFGFAIAALWTRHEAVARRWKTVAVAPLVPLLAVFAFAGWAMQCDAAKLGFAVDWAGVAVIAFVTAVAVLSAAISAIGFSARTLR